MFLFLKWFLGKYIIKNIDIIRNLINLDYYFWVFFGLLFLLILNVVYR